MQLLDFDRYFERKFYLWVTLGLLVQKLLHCLKMFTFLHQGSLLLSLHILAFYKTFMVLCLYILSVAAFCSSVVQNLIASLVSEFGMCAKIKFAICNLLVLQRSL